MSPGNSATGSSSMQLMPRSTSSSSFCVARLKVLGTLVPLGLKAMKVDPALGSSVFITTFTDVVGFASFLGLATVFLRYLVH